MALPSNKPGFLKGPDFYSCLFILKNTNKKHVVNKTKQTSLEELFFVEGQSTSVDVVTFCTGQDSCQGSTLEKLVL